jgi:hypothetical protein
MELLFKPAPVLRRNAGSRSVMPAPRWRRSANAWPEKAATFGPDDWTLIDADGARLARIYDAGQEDGVEPGRWRWRVYRADGPAIGGSAETGPEERAARMIGRRECPSTAFDPSSPFPSGMDRLPHAVFTQLQP